MTFMKYIDLLLKLFLIVDFFFIKFYLTYLKDTLTQIQPKESSQTQTRVEILLTDQKSQTTNLKDQNSPKLSTWQTIKLNKTHTNY